MKYSTESLREKFNGLKVSVTGSRDDVAQWKGLVNKYLETHDYVAAEGIINKILEAVPTDQFANNLYKQMQDWKYLQVVNGILVSYSGKGEHLVLPKGIKEIGDEAFKGSSIKYIIIQEGTEKIGKRSFEECYLLQKVHIPSTVVEIDDRAFRNCSMLDITVPQSVTKLGHSCFSGCDLRSADISRVVDIGNYVFANCKSLTQIWLPKGLKRLPSGLLEGTGFTDYCIPESIEEVEKFAFSGCVKLRSVNMSPNIVSIGDYSFAGCEMLESVRLPDGLKRIGYHAFQDCSNLQSVYIPSSISAKEMPSDVFEGCERLESVEWSNISRYIGEGYSWNDEWWEGKLGAFQHTPFWMQRIEKEKTKEERRMRREYDACQYCGGSFYGLIIRRCSKCGKVKDY